MALAGLLVHPRMRRYLLLILGVLVLAWAILAIVTGSPTLKKSGSKESAEASPACLPSTLTHSARLPGTAVSVSPAPGTVTANPQSQISFLGAPASKISDVTVSGSHSGTHTGHLTAYSQGDGASFAADRQFDTGEQVKVTASVADRSVSFDFRVDTPYPTSTVKDFDNAQAAPADYQSFYTQPGVQAPVMSVTVPDRDPGAGDILTTNGPGPGQYGPLIYRPDGSLVWFQRLSEGETAENLNEQTYEGQRVLTWWRGRVLVLGDPGPWICAGMTGGVLYLRPQSNLNFDLQAIKRRISRGAKVVILNMEDSDESNLHTLLTEYAEELTRSQQPDEAEKALALRKNWHNSFVRIVPSGSRQLDQSVATE